ncbi:MAG: thiolase domain-containing protein, partial [Rhizobiaceae bacterium]|nr:thiolase domain-containing protein [Rhizobiaceae bacterium]
MAHTHIVGWGHTKFGRLEDKSLEDLIIEAAEEAIDHAGIQASDIDAIFLGHFNAGLVADGFPSSLVLNLDDGLRFKPATRLENACASGSAALYAGRDAIAAGSARTVLVIGAEKMTSNDTKGVTKALSGAAYQKEEQGVSFPSVFARFAQAYFQAYGDQSLTLAKIAAKNHANATNNPLAHMQKALSVDFCNTISDKNPVIAAPLRMSDCSLISDGASAVVMVSDDLS